MFVHQERLLLFVAAALAVAMHMGTIASSQAAAVPAAFRSARGNGLHVVVARQAGQHTVPNTTSFLRRMAANLQRRPANERQVRRRGRTQKRNINRQAVLQTDDTSAGSGQCGSSGSGSSSSSVSEPTATATATDDSDAFPTVTSVSMTATSSSSSQTQTQTSTTSSSASSSTATAIATGTTTNTAASPIATIPTGAGTKLILRSNTADYGWDEAMADLNSIMSWAGDDGNLTDDEKTEVVAAILSGSARFWPEVPTRVMMRIMLADIRAESDFRPRVIGGARLDSGASWGLMQLSPGAGAQLLPLYVDHFNAATHNFTWGIDAPNVRAGVRGALIDWQTGKMIDLASITNDDLLRPWINIHAGMWIQSNLARMASADPWMWTAANDYSWALKQAKTGQLTAQQNATYTTLLQGAGLSRSPRTALGSWVAGAATNGAGSYLSSGDDISAQYLATIMKSVNFLYNRVGGSEWQPEWLERWTVNAGLTDYV